MAHGKDCCTEIQTLAPGEDAPPIRRGSLARGCLGGPPPPDRSGFLPPTRAAVRIGHEPAGSATPKRTRARRLGHAPGAAVLRDPRHQRRSGILPRHLLLRRTRGGALLLLSVSRVGEIIMFWREAPEKFANFRRGSQKITPHKHFANQKEMLLSK